MEKHQLLNVLHEVLRIAKRSKAVPGHPGTHHLVVMEADAALPEFPGVRLADVVEQGGQAQPEAGRRLLCDCHRVSKHVLVTVDRVLSHGQYPQFR